METAKLKKFAQFARRSLIKQISAKLELVLTENSSAQRESAEAIKKLNEAIKSYGREHVIDRVAYTWFNRFCALRFMDVNRYNQIGNSRLGVVSPAEGQFQPEILAEAKSGHIEKEMLHDKIRQQIFALLEGKSPSRDPQGEAYRLLVVGACNYWHRAMPFLFERIDDYTELLMPDDLLSGNSILAYTREAMTPDACQDVEVIGWLYQFYISEKKDEVFEGLKKNRKITPENIPAATQLFTPHWIVRYLVENSLGRLWMLNRPNSKLIEQMDYYIKPEQPESDFLQISKPEEIKICDPTCGSGHMLTYAFDILYAIYEEDGYEPSEIAEMILTHNLYGIEIDERAGELAAFALTMKARARQRRFFRKPIQPNICVLRNIQFDDAELKNYMDFIGRDLFTAPLQATLKQFEEADNFGSLICPEVTNVAAMLKILEAKNVSGQLFLGTTHKKVLQALQQADYLSPKYHVVIANPPYMGKGGMNATLGEFLASRFSSTKSDLFSAFIERCTQLIQTCGYSGFMTPFVWMYLSTYEPLRNLIIGQHILQSLVKPSYTSFFQSAIVPICAFTIRNSVSDPDYYGHYFDLGYLGNAEEQSPRFLSGLKGIKPYSAKRRTVADFKNIPGSPIAFQFPSEVFSLFKNQEFVKSYASSLVKGIFTGDNNRFLRFWFEIPSTGFSSGDWRRYNKAGGYRKWYGIAFHAIDWRANGQELKNFKGAGLSAASNFGKPHIVWGKLTSGDPSFRFDKDETWFDDASPAVIEPKNYSICLGLLNSNSARLFLKTFNPTMNLQPGDVSKVPYPAIESDERIEVISNSLCRLSRSDWDSYETSWDFSCLPLLNSDNSQPTLKATYQNLHTQWQETTLEMQRLEEENNRIFIDAYGLQDELTPEVPLNEITLTCNPHYRYSNNRNTEELEALLLADTMKEFVSYAVGCMFGRYALDKPGLILANQGDTIEEYLRQIPDPTFPADADNVIPILDGDWFTDDISERFRKFLRITFGEEHYEENLKFIEVALGKEIRKYFLKDFYNDHVRRYKKRPIYWLFRSPNGSFNALTYMHRYRPDTASVVLNGYLREFRTKLISNKSRSEAESISANATSGQKSEALRKIDRFKTMIAELESYEREVLYPIATKQIPINLDEGVKVNYQKFGLALKKIPGLDATED